jgi:hypothetical protein
VSARDDPGDSDGRPPAGEATAINTFDLTPTVPHPYDQDEARARLAERVAAVTARRARTRAVRGDLQAARDAGKATRHSARERQATR